MKKITVTLFLLALVGVGGYAQVAVNYIEEVLVTPSKIKVSVDFFNPDATKKAAWYIKTLDNITPFGLGEIVAVDGAIIEVSEGLQPETTYEVRVSVDTFNTYESITVTTPAVLSSKSLVEKQFTARLTGTTLAIESDAPKNFKIYNIIGNQIADGMVDPGGSKKVDLSMFPAGYYFVSDGGIVIRIFLSPH